MYPNEVVIYEDDSIADPEKRKVIKLEPNTEFSIEKTTEDGKMKVEVGAAVTLNVSQTNASKLLLYVPYYSEVFAVAMIYNIRFYSP